MNHPTLHYRTFDQLLSDAAVDLPTLHQEGFIEPAQLIKVAQRVNYDLGLKIHQEKIAVLDIQRGRVKLPEDCYQVNYGAICMHFQIEEPVITGTQTEEVIVPPVPDTGHPCPCSPSLCLTRCGEHMVLKQTFKTQVRHYDVFAPLRLRPHSLIASGCPNLQVQASHQGYVQHGFLHTSFAEGTVFIHYLGNLEDEQGHLLIPDHPLLNEYYEYAIKQRVLENMLLDGEPVTDRLVLIEKRLRDARNNALSLVNMPDFQELRQTIEMNRQAMFQRYYAIFL